MHGSDSLPARTGPCRRWATVLSRWGTIFVALACTNLVAQAHGAVAVNTIRFHLVSGPCFAVKATPVTKTDIADINDSLLNTTVEIQATVKSVTRPREGSKAPFKLDIADETGRINLTIWSDNFEVIESRYNLAPGDLIRVRARVKEFRGELELELRNAGDLKMLSKGGSKSGPETGGPSAKGKDQSTTPLSKINESMMNQELYVQASITDVKEPRSERAPYIVTLSEGGTQIPMVYWSDVQSSVASQIRVGNVIRAKLTVSEHRGTLQLKLRDARDLKLVGGGSDKAESDTGETGSAEESESGGGTVKIRSITEAWSNRNVAISGRIVASDAIGQGQRLLVRDDTGEIRVILWDNVLSQIPATEFQSGRSISVTGRVKVYRGQPEIVPDSAEAVTVSGD